MHVNKYCSVSISVALIGHQYVGMDGAAVFLSGHLKLFQKKPIIRVRREDRLAIVPALDHVLRLVSQHIPWQTGHGLPPPWLNAPARQNVSGESTPLVPSGLTYQPKACR